MRTPITLPYTRASRGRVEQIRSFGGNYIANGGYDAERAEAAITAGETDFVSFGSAFLANPDLVARIKAGAPLNQPDPATFYQGEERGYTDYPTMSASS
ncbi:MAG: hypothetical protein M0Z28_14665 [Rhodospirillales bacterium]|nr:hypothetical protein [Rhodospirillales bacterium]